MELHMVLLSTILAFALASTEQSVSSPTITANTSTTTPKSCPHPEYQLYPDHNCYKAFPTQCQMKTWTEARQQCIGDGGDLMVLESEREREEVYIPLRDSVRWNTYWPWVGVYIPQGGDDWITVKGEPALSTWWWPGEPDQYADRKCAFAYNNGLMGNYNCASNQTFICEISL